MTTNLSPDAAAEAAQRLLNDRVDAVRTLAKARQQRLDARAQLDEAERADAMAYAAAQRAGWSTDELRKVGFEEPERKAPGRPRRARSARGGAAENNARDDGQQ
jgi:flagellar biosynthesis/type III secretory pathway protein FliH